MGDGTRDWRGWRLLAAMGAVAVVVAIGFLGWRLSSSASAESVAGEAIAAQGGVPADTGTTSAKMLVVYVSGAVAHPGTYRLAPGLRVGDALAAAGGVTPDADPNRMPNVAAKLTDGKQIKVPRKGASGSAASKLDINTASEAQLMLVPGMPANLAHEIVAFRTRYGPYSSVTDLKTVLSIDAATLAAIRRYLTVG